MTREWGRRAALAAGAGAVSACALPVREAAVPREDTGRATVLGLPNERFVFGRSLAPLGAEFEAALERLRRDGADPLVRYDMLAVSGGGEDGAFGAGLLTAWPDRPRFALVTGVSTGALTAPFAFLGPEWDAGLSRVYTEISLSDVLVQRWFWAAVWGDALADTAPLFRTISRELDQGMPEAIAREYRRGRPLLVGTTNLDAQVPVVWNIGAIAASGHPRALEVIRKVLLASAAIPGAFPPVLFDVTVDGRPHQELHVDGGAVAQAFLYPSVAASGRRDALRAGRRVLPARAWLIRNARMDADWASTSRRAVSIAGRAVQTMISSSGHNDAIRTWLNAERDGIEFRMSGIGADFDVKYEKPLDRDDMRALYAYGQARMRAGAAWASQPAPHVTPRAGRLIPGGRGGIIAPP